MNLDFWVCQNFITENFKIRLETWISVWSKMEHTRIWVGYVTIPNRMFYFARFLKKKIGYKILLFLKHFLFRGFVIWSNVSAGWQLKIKQSWKQECSRWFTLSVKFNHFWSSFWIKSLVILIFLEGYRLIWWHTHDSSKNRHFRASSGKSLVLW